MQSTSPGSSHSLPAYNSERVLCTICWSVVGLREFNVVIEYQNFDVKLIRVIGHKSQAQIPQVKDGFML